eukprot:TRINITY_DN3474_c0_g1_i1.p1 TRINITY_DN3474_c0_g1~~TRINITY_DN3474_c0_g1_i1.p1  ORF type:complete len:429 (-),score=72.31 TRINITY_DN3474_c0_g1_i1:117-1403(-)
MLRFTQVTLLVAVHTNGLEARLEADPQLQQDRISFEDFKQRFGRYYNTFEEEERRFGVFRGNLREVEQLNERNGQSVFGITPLADRDLDELPRRGHKTMIDPETDSDFTGDLPTFDNDNWTNWTEMSMNETEELPRFLDWRLTPVITPVKNQGQCGSCWAHSVVESVEAQFVLLNGEVLGQQLFSVQQVTSCVPSNMSDGCGGGDLVAGFYYLSQTPGLAQAEFWPYAQGFLPSEACSDLSCTQSCNARNVTQVTEFAFFIGYYATVTGARYAIPPCYGECEDQDLEGLARALTQVGPLSIVVNAGAWSFYRGGVLTAEGCGNSTFWDLDHAVQLVGFNTLSSPPYWIVRNSWSTTWGESGFIYLEYGKNTCGLANSPIYPTLNDALNSSWDTRKQRFQHFYERATGLGTVPLAWTDTVKEAQLALHI